MTFMLWLLFGWISSSPARSKGRQSAPGQVGQEAFPWKAALLCRAFVIRKKDLRLIILIL